MLAFYKTILSFKFFGNTRNRPWVTILRQFWRILSITVFASSGLEKVIPMGLKNAHIAISAIDGYLRKIRGRQAEPSARLVWVIL